MYNIKFIKFFLIFCLLNKKILSDLNENNNYIEKAINNYLNKEKSDFKAKVDNINSIEEKIFMHEKDKFNFIDDMFPKIEKESLGINLLYGNFIERSKDYLLNNYMANNSKNIDAKLKEFNNYVLDILFTIEDPYKFKCIISKTDPTFLEQIFNRKDRSEKFYAFYKQMSPEQKDIFYKRLDAGYNKYMLEIVKKNAILISYLTGTMAVGFIGISFFSNLLNTIINNLMQPFFNRWGKHKNFLAKLEFNYIANYNLSNIAGYADLKKQFLDIANELIEQKWRLSKIEGICLHGEPGNGKTQIIKALAGQAGIPLVIVNLNTLLNENGQIEENLNLLFEEARKKSPCIILLDEFDLIAGSRKLGKLSDGEKAILNEVLQQLDGGKSSLEGILVVANTNVISNIDFALQRPGRLGRVIEVKAPNKEDIKEITKFYLEEYKINYDDEFIEYFIEKLVILPNINVAMIKNYIQKVKKYMKKNKQNKLIQQNFEVIMNQILI